jgi:hypothetical protein
MAVVAGAALGQAQATEPFPQPISGFLGNTGRPVETPLPIPAGHDARPTASGLPSWHNALEERRVMEELQRAIEAEFQSEQRRMEQVRKEDERQDKRRRMEQGGQLQDLGIASKEQEERYRSKIEEAQAALQQAQERARREEPQRLESTKPPAIPRLYGYCLTTDMKAMCALVSPDLLDKECICYEQSSSGSFSAVAGRVFKWPVFRSRM